jgi:Rrf2 family transcriptional regulator, iron-sulfur cluster assembly transcription factor
MIYQKTTQNAIAAVSRLAEAWSEPEVRLSSRDIAEDRNLPVPIVAKILTELSRAGLVTGSPGPGGGYRLARPPREITLRDVAGLFERDGQTACPYGPGWCGSGQPCPLHDSMLAMQQKINSYLEKTNFAAFQAKGNVRTAKSRRKSR